MKEAILGSSFIGKGKEFQTFGAMLPRDLISDLFMKKLLLDPRVLYP